MSESQGGSVPPTGVWVSFYSDRSGVKVHADEISALRTAVADSSQVKLVPFGADVWEVSRA